MKALSKGILILFLATILSLFTFGLWSVIETEPAQAAVYVVNTVVDTPGAPFPGVPGELRWAINSANAITPGVPDTINFNIPAPPGPVTIIPAAPLPTIVDTVLIDGATQTAFAPGTVIELSGAGAGPSDGLYFTFTAGPPPTSASGSQVRGLVINNWLQSGVVIDGVTGVQVDGNYIGTDWTGAVLTPNFCGVQIKSLSGPSSANIIGGTAPANRNVISGNASDGIVINGSNGNFVEGNYIGTNAAGNNPIPNTNNGIWVDNVSSGNTIGGTTSGQGNLISGNGGNGIEIHYLSAGNFVQGNLIGTDFSGIVQMGNGGDGIYVWNSSNGNTIGGNAVTNPALCNVISGNGNDGIEIDGSTGNFVQGNLIGTDIGGANPVGNTQNGVYLINSANTNTIGGSTAGLGNLISGNSNHGIEIDGSTGNSIEGNLVGTDSGGAARLPNGANGIELRNSASSNTIGGATAGHRNVISGNTGHGVRIAGSNSVTVEGNYIGTDMSGTAIVYNGSDGVRLDGGAVGNTIGGTASSPSNVISGNGVNGVGIESTAGNNTVEGNYIGLDATGGVALGNTSCGVSINLGSTGNTIGGTAAGQGNTISGNGSSGIIIDGSTGNFVEGNLIGTDPTGTDPSGTRALGNGQQGVYLFNANNNTVGGSTTAHRNVISNNVWNGVQIDGCSGCTVSANFIGLGASGAALGNGSQGVMILGGSSANTVGGDTTATPALRNYISGNSAYGVNINNANGNFVEGNFIGTNTTGGSAVPNGQSGVGIFSGSTANVIGGVQPNQSNLISGNTGNGVYIAGSTGNFVQGNLIGTNAAGTGAVANQQSGIRLNNGANTNTIGGSHISQGNTISGNTQSGIRCENSTGNAVEGNYIGTNVGGTGAVPNGGDGIYLNNSGNSNTIGSSVSTNINVISGNGGNGILVDGSTGITIKGNLIGTDAAGTAKVANTGSGIYLQNGADSNSIGGTTSAERNVISGNLANGVGIDGSTLNTVSANHIGTNQLGSAALGNSGRGVILLNGATVNTIGGTTFGETNVISGNLDGVYITGSGSTGNLIHGNYIGTDGGGGGSVFNLNSGVEITGGANGNLIGGNSSSYRNLISGNGGNGVLINGGSPNTIQGNYIGTTSGGNSPVPNFSSGIFLQSGNGNTVGGSNTGEGNLISGNGLHGIRIASNSNAVEGNLVGVDAAGTARLTNGGDGIYVASGASSNTIGGNTAGHRNVISGNTGNGISIDNAVNNSVEGNYIGLDATGAPFSPNNSIGVWIGNSSSGNTIGGSITSYRNIISSNTGDGVYIGSSANGNSVQGNYIGTNVAGTLGFPNGGNGVSITGGANNNTIGGVPPTGMGNAISSNAGNGVEISGATGNSIEGNYIGTNATGAAALANTQDGVRIASGANNNTVGGTIVGLRNFISGNGGDGISIDNSTGTDILRNYIGTDAAGTGSIPNTLNGIDITNNANNTTVGGTSADANLIANNSQYGVGIQHSIDCEVSYNQITGNSNTGVVVWDLNSFRDKISQNSIYGSGLLGIDLMGDGVTANDGNNNNPAKANRGYNFPVFSASQVPVIAGTTYASGTAPPNAIVEFYYTGPAPSILGHGEGQTYLGQTTADGSGNFSTTLTGLSAGDSLSAISISPAGDPSGAGNTSEFSANATVATGYNVTASVTGGNGTVDPTFQPIVSGNNASIDIYPDAHYHIASIIDNTVSQTVANPYTINNVTADHTVVVTFAIDTNTVDASVTGGHGTVDPTTQDIDYGSDATIDIYPNAGYHIDTITDNGNPQTVANPFKIYNVTAYHNVVVTFAIDTFTVDASVSGGGGSVDPATQTVDYGSDATINIDALEGFHTDTITDNAAPVAVADPYVISNVQADHTVVVTFAEDTQPNEFYFAEGYTGSGFQEYLCLGQPVDADLEVTVTYLFKDGSTMEREYTVPGLSRFTVNVNAEVGADKEVSVKCEADWGFVAERPMYFKYQGAWTGGHDVVGASAPAGTWYFAEGYTGPGFDEWICVLNPGDDAADLTFRFQTQEEGEKTVTGFSVPAHSRASFKANDLLGGAYQTSLTLESTQPVVAERPMYFDYQGTGGWGWSGGHCVMGASQLATEYYFAEGTTRGGFEEWLTIQNPGLNPIDVQATYMLGTGEIKQFTYPVPASKRSTIYVPGEVGVDQDVSVQLTCASPFLAERPMYFSYMGMGGWGWTGGHCVIGATASAQAWFFAEGYTGSGFEEWLCIQNPGDSDAAVAVTYYPEGGADPITREHEVAANARYTIPVNVDAGADLAISAEITSNQPIIVERPMYFSYGAGWAGGHDVVGYIP